MMSSTENSSSNESRLQSKRKKLVRVRGKKKFQEKWLENPRYNGWLEKSKDIHKCRCAACAKEFSAGTSELDKHANGDKHKAKVAASKMTPSCSTFNLNKNEEHEMLVKTAEIKICTYFAEHNVAFMAVDHFTDLLKEIIPDSKIVKDIKLKRTKCSEILKNVICKQETSELVGDLTETKFSVLIDESTDICDKKSLCVLAKYVKKTSGLVETKLLELIEIDAKDCSAKKLYGEFKDCLNRFSIPIENVIGVASDGASVMIGNRNSFFSHLQEDVPEAILMRCICHSSAIVASKACANLPRTAEDLMRAVYTYVSGSAKRSAMLVEMQEYFNKEEKNKILRLANTRWLSMHNCVVRMLSNWEALINYFRVAAIEDQLKTADTILNSLSNPIIKAYFYFLKYSLNSFNQFNALFQSNTILIHQLYSKSESLLLQICHNFLIPESFDQNILTLNIRHPHNFLDTNKIYVGQECETLLKSSLQSNSISAGDVYSFKNNCIKFYQTAAEEIQKRFFQNGFFKDFCFLEPQIALEIKGRDKIPNLEALSQKFSNYGIDTNELELEWRNLPFIDNSLKEKLYSLKIDELWFEISKIKNFEDKLTFPNVSKLAGIILCLPHSNAAAERIFSIVSDVKSKKRNRIGHEALNAVCVIRSSLSACNRNCVTFKVTNDHLKLHKYSMYSFKK